MNGLKKIKLRNKKGVLGLDIAKSFVLAILILAIIAFAAIVSLGELNGVFTNDGSAQGNLTEGILNAIVDNTSDGVTDFFSNAGSWFALLAVVIIILIVSVVIVVVNKFGRGNQL